MHLSKVEEEVRVEEVEEASPVLTPGAAEVRGWEETRDKTLLQCTAIL